MNNQLNTEQINKKHENLCYSMIITNLSETVKCVVKVLVFILEVGRQTEINLRQVEIIFLGNFKEKLFLEGVFVENLSGTHYVEFFLSGKIYLRYFSQGIFLCANYF